ncbi:efflux pump antibiotic resistance protein [Aspergillus eucalypticola CBS 122712]|uniref:Efflux pump antibiotic resistance protein n=1 Tax=Aspergillus eucalypticola (strain CBS 122712 / IBT 29274) TaxID=1448314 RepID=A0A317UNC8_ASPEC|nr:efflux pump antibiotic resistance protein [Aspergillus eucalypticola CBS 122712]PWY62638.1 efflux pump antibiotic resistance protein [Aspergillus eucalypticola CBS 122712]
MAVDTEKPPAAQISMEETNSIQSEGSASQATTPTETWRLAIVIVSLCCGTFLVALDTTIISVAVPSISTTFQAFDDVGWYGSAYLLTVTAFQPAFGNVFQLFDAKATYLSVAVLFEAGSVLCAASPSSTAFIVGRAITGVGAAGLYQGALSIVGLSVPLEKRPMYLGIVLSVFGIAACLGPPLGGILTQHVTWRWCFWINLPIGGVAIILVLFFLKLQDRRAKPADSILARLRSFDYIGITLTIAWVSCLILAMQFGSSSSKWRSSKVIGLFVGAGLLLIAFFLSQWYQGERSTVPLRVARQRSVLMGALYSFFLEISIYVTLYYIPFYFQSAQLVSPTVSGIRGIPLGVSQIAGVVLTGAIVSITGHYVTRFHCQVPFMVLGQVISIIGTACLTKLEVGTSTALWATFLVIAGVGHGLGLQMPFTAVQVVLNDDDIPIGNAITVFFSQLGAAIAVAIGESIFETSVAHQVRTSDLPIAAETVIAAGPTGLRSLTTDATTLRALQDAYAYGIRAVMDFGLAAACLAVPFALAMEWRNVKKEAASKKLAKEATNGDENEESTTEKQNNDLEEGK